MAERPLLVFPAPSQQQREKANGRGASPHLPSWSKQRARLAPQFRALEKAFAEQTPMLQPSLTGAPPEQVLVFETVGPIDQFIRNVKKIEGMEWLVELVVDIEPDDNFYFETRSEEDEKKIDVGKQLSGRLYLIHTNRRALEELLSRWRRYRKSDEKFPRGEGRWRELFRLLHNVRPWNVDDRLHPDVLADWAARVSAEAESVKVEVELWHRATEEARKSALTRFARLVAGEPGRELSRVSLPDIAYTALLIELPIASVKAILRSRDTKLVRSGDVMFFRPAPQLAVASPSDIYGEAHFSAPDASKDEPVLALLDGLPLERHESISGRLIVDDPDDWAASYPAAARVHGTAMASLILRGDLNGDGKVLSRPLVVRPILRPVGTHDGATYEEMPQNLLPVDLVHRAVRRLFDGDGQETAVAPSVRVINFSIGDRSRLFDNQISPLARLLDWLSQKYNVLFVVSAGNHVDRHPDYLALDIKTTDLPGATPEEVERSTVRAVLKLAYARRLHSPAEAMNALTVAATQKDQGPPNQFPTLRELTYSAGCPSPLNALGLGYNRSVKPDLLAPGGRAYYKFEELPQEYARFSVSTSDRAPACLVGSPGNQGSLRGCVNSCGTSNAAALTTREAARLIDSLDDVLLADGTHGSAASGEHLPLLLRALLIHTARWGDARRVVLDALGSDVPPHIAKQHLARLLGYGLIDPDRARGCSQERATVFATGVIMPGAGHAYALPLPSDLAGKKIWRRLTMTLAWLSPINPETRAYRKVRMWFDPPREDLRVRRFADDKMVRRGTVQHEVLEGDEASAFGANATLAFVVNCELESGDKADVAYAVAATLEVAPGERIRVYEQVRDGLRAQIQVSPKVAANA